MLSHCGGRAVIKGHTLIRYGETNSPFQALPGRDGEGSASHLQNYCPLPCPMGTKCHENVRDGIYGVVLPLSANEGLAAYDTLARLSRPHSLQLCVCRLPAVSLFV